MNYRFLSPCKYDSCAIVQRWHSMYLCLCNYIFVRKAVTVWNVQKIDLSPRTWFWELLWNIYIYIYIYNFNIKKNNGNNSNKKRFHFVDIYEVFLEYRRFPSLLNVPAILIYILLLLAVVRSIFQVLLFRSLCESLLSSNYICGFASFIIKRSDVILKSTEALCVAVGGTITDGA